MSALLPLSSRPVILSKKAISFVWQDLLSMIPYWLALIRFLISRCVLLESQINFSWNKWFYPAIPGTEQTPGKIQISLQLYILLGFSKFWQVFFKYFQLDNSSGIFFKSSLRLVGELLVMILSPTGHIAQMERKTSSFTIFNWKKWLMNYNCITTTSF